MGSRSSMQGVAWHYVNSWELKEKDEFAWNTNEKKKRKKKKKNKQKNNKQATQVKRYTPVSTRKILGSFILKFEGEEEQEFIIGENINSEAEIVKLVIKGYAGKIITINNEKVLIVSKNLK